MLKGLDGAKINEVSNAVMELLQGQGGALSNLLSTTSAFTQNLAARDQLIGDVINNLNTVLGTVDEKGAQFDASVDQLQKLLTGLAQGRDPDRGRHPAAGVGRERPDRHAVAVASADTGRDRERRVRSRSGSTSERRMSTRSSSRSPKTICDSTHSVHTDRSSTSSTARRG